MMSIEEGLEQDNDPGLSGSTNTHSYEALFNEDNCASMMLFKYKVYDSC